MRLVKRLVGRSAKRRICVELAEDAEYDLDRHSPSCGMTLVWAQVVCRGCWESEHRDVVMRRLKEVDAHFALHPGDGLSKEERRECREWLKRNLGQQERVV